ncbi:MAG: hypothetical protein GY722_02910 [bacterium]|nr:hypothetical protein [bacterium]
MHEFDAEALGRVEGKVDQVLERVGDLRQEQREHAKRLRSLESIKSRAIGALAVVSAAVGALLTNWKK